MDRAEILRECYRQRGYIVTWQAQFEGEPPLREGEILPYIGGEGLDLGQPCFVMGETDKQDLIEQLELCRALSPQIFRAQSPVEYVNSQLVGRVARYFRLGTD